MKRIVFVFLLVAVQLSFWFFYSPFAKADPADTIHITQTVGQYNITTRDRVYILDNDLTSDSGGIVVSADNIVLDLNGKTVTFGNDITKHSRYGVAIPPGYVNTTTFPGVPSAGFVGADTIVIKNGNIIHGADGTGCAVIFSREGNEKVEVANIKGKYRGIDSQGIVFFWARDLYIHDDSVEAALTEITNRHHAKGAIFIEGFLGGSLKVQDNTLYGNGHVGIRLMSKKSYPTTEVICSGNKMHIHGITTNSIMLLVTGFSESQQGTDIQIYENRVTSPGSVANRGFYFDGIDASMDGVDGAKVYGNYIECKEHGHVEYGVDGFAHCFRMRDAGNGVKKNFNNEFYADTFIANGYWVSADTHGGAWGVRLGNSATLTTDEANVFHDNIFIANSQDTHSVCKTYCVGFESHSKYSNTLFYDNEFTSNSNFFEWYHLGGDSATFRSNTLTMGSDTTHFNTFYFYNFDSGNDATGYIFLDNVLDGVTYKTMYLHSYDPQPRSFYVKWYANVNVKDSLGQNVQDAIVKGYDKDDSLHFTNTTDASGNAQLVLTDMYFYTAGTDTTSAWTYYNPYTVIVSKEGQSAQTQVVMNASKQIILKINGENYCPSVPSLNLPVDGDTILGLRPTLILNNSNDSDGDILMYDFEVYSDSQLTSLVVSGTNVLEGENITSWQVTIDLPDENWYWWRARGYDGICYSEWSNKRSFYVKQWVAEVGDSQPTLRSPVDGAVLTNLRPVLEIYNIIGFDSLLYFFQVDSDSQFTNPIQSEPVAGQDIMTNWRVSNKLSTGGYCWRARAFDGSEFSLWSDVGKFSLTSEVYVYPNPFKPTIGDETIVFSGIPIGSDIKVTTLSGELVKKFADTQESEITWDAKNQEGKEIASGVYLYFVDFVGGSTSGKIVIIR